MSSERRLALSNLGKAPIVLAVLFAAVLPIIIAVVALLQVGSGELSPVVMLAIQGLIAVLTLGVVLPMWRREATFDGERLRVKATYYTRQALVSDFNLDQARAVDLREHTELKPLIKTNGMAMPGLLAGHFGLRDGRKAFCLVTDRSKVLALPHADGRIWLLGLEHPQAVLDILRRSQG
jgi:hypothetical protein